MITLDREIAFFWNGRLSSAAALFYVNRYSCLFGFIYNFFLLSPLSDKVSAPLSSGLRMNDITHISVEVPPAPSLLPSSMPDAKCCCAATIKAQFAVYLEQFVFPSGQPINIHLIPLLTRRTVFATLRAYALSRNKLLSGAVFFLSAVVPIGTSVVCLLSALQG